MPARTKGRAKFSFRDRSFLWWIDGDKYIRICSLDKTFIIAVPIGIEGPSVLEVIGHDFPGIDPAETRPVRLLTPVLDSPTTSMGAQIDLILRWCFDPGHALNRYEGPVRFL